MLKSQLRFIRSVEWLSSWSGKVSSWLIMMMVGVISLEVMFRYFFSSPTNWAYELTTMLYGSYCLLVGAYTHLHKGHIRMDILYNRWSVRTQNKVDFILGFLSVGFLILFIWLSMKFAIISWQMKEYSSTSTWQVPMYPFKFTMPLAAFLLLLQQLVVMVRNYTVIKRGDTDII